MSTSRITTSDVVVIEKRDGRSGLVTNVKVDGKQETISFGTSDPEGLKLIAEIEGLMTQQDLSVWNHTHQADLEQLSAETFRVVKSVLEQKACCLSPPNLA